MLGKGEKLTGRTLDREGERERERYRVHRTGYYGKKGTNVNNKMKIK